MVKTVSSGRSLNILEGRAHLELSYLAKHCTGIVVTLSYVAMSWSRSLSYVAMSWSRSLSYVAMSWSRSLSYLAKHCTGIVVTLSYVAMSWSRRLEMNTVKINIKRVGSHFGIGRWYSGMEAAIRSVSRNVNQQGDVHCSPVPWRPTAMQTSLRRRMAKSWYRALPKIHASKVELWPSIYSAWFTNRQTQYILPRVFNMKN